MWVVAKVGGQDVGSNKIERLRTSWLEKETELAHNVRTPVSHVNALYKDTHYRGGF